MTSSFASPSSLFCKKFGPDWDLTIFFDAKRGDKVPEIRGPARYKRDKEVEFTIFLPYDTIIDSDDIIKSAVESLLDAVCQVFDLCEIDTTGLLKQRATIVEKICSDPTMLEDE